MPTLKDLVDYCDKRTRLAAFKDAPGALCLAAKKQNSC